MIWDDDFVLRQGSTMMVASNQNEDGRVRIYVTSKFVMLEQEKPYALAGIWHEIGHVHCGHLELGLGGEVVRKMRREALMSGGVFDFELEADAFAVRAAGKNRVIQFLQYCRDSRLKNKAQDTNADLAALEFKRRIQAVKRFKLS